MTQSHPASETPGPQRAKDEDRWLAVFSVAVACFALVTTEFLPVGLLTAIARDLGVSDGAAGLMVGVPGSIAAIAAPVLTVASGTLDRRIALLGMTCCLLVSDIVSAFTASFPVMLAARALFGIAVGGFWAIGVTVGSRLVKQANVVRATSVIFSGISLGTLIGVPAGALIGSLAGWRAAFLTAGALSLAILAAQVAWLPKLPESRPVKVRDLFGVFENRNARTGLITVFFAIFGQFAAYTYVNPVLIEITRVSPATLAQALLLYGIAGIGGNFLGGLGAERNLRGALLAVLSLLGITVLAFAHSANSTFGACALLAVWGAAWGALPILHQTWALRSSPRMSKGGSALFVSVFQGSIALGAGMGGVAVEAIGIVAGISLSGLSILAGLAVSAVCSEPFDE